MIYIASLYSNGLDMENTEHLEVLDQRVKYTMKRVCDFMFGGEYPYSPILHCHSMSKEFSLPKVYEYWQETDRNAISHCDKVYVLMMKDDLGKWEDSIGITDEIYYASSIGKEIVFFKCDDY